MSFRRSFSMVGKAFVSGKRRRGLLRLNFLFVGACVLLATGSGVCATEFFDFVNDPLRTAPPVLASGAILPGDSEPIDCSPRVDLARPLALGDAVDLALCNGSVREICGVAHVVSLTQRILGVMAPMRRLIQEVEMRKPNMKRIVTLLRQLSPSQLKAVAVEMAALETRSGATAVIEGRGSAGTLCPHCRSERVRRHGQANGLQRYRCVECRRTFNALSGTPLSGLHKREHWLGQAEALRDARPLRTVAKELGIHVGTAHRWRHRFLACPQAAMPAALVGIAEVDETMFLLSFKGQRTLPRQARKRGGKAAKRGLSHEQVPVLVARDRAGVTADCVLKATDAASLAKALKPFVPADLVLCSDGSAALAAAARQLGVEHHAINLSAGIRVDGAWHIQNVNAYHSRLKTWVRKFNGVATRYLANYLGWFRTMDRESALGLKPAQWLALAMGRHA